MTKYCFLYSWSVPKKMDNIKALLRHVRTDFLHATPGEKKVKFHFVRINEVGELKTGLNFLCSTKGDGEYSFSLFIAEVLS